MKTVAAIFGCIAAFCSVSAWADEVPSEEIATASPSDPGGAAQYKDDWRVQLFNGDDIQFVICNGLPMLPRADFKQSIDVNLKECILQGRRNEIEIGLFNRAEGYTWGFRILRNKAVVSTVAGKPAESTCGQAGTVGCDNNAQAPAGIVRRWKFHFGG